MGRHDRFEIPEPEGRADFVRSFKFFGRIIDLGEGVKLGDQGRIEVQQRKANHGIRFGSKSSITDDDKVPIALFENGRRIRDFVVSFEEAHSLCSNSERAGAWSVIYDDIAADAADDARLQAMLEKDLGKGGGSESNGASRVSEDGEPDSDEAPEGEVERVESGPEARAEQGAAEDEGKSAPSQGSAAPTTTTTDAADPSTPAGPAAAAAVASPAIATTTQQSQKGDEGGASAETMPGGSEEEQRGGELRQAQGFELEQSFDVGAYTLTITRITEKEQPQGGGHTKTSYLFNFTVKEGGETLTLGCFGSKLKRIQKADEPGIEELEGLIRKKKGRVKTEGREKKKIEIESGKTIHIQGGRGSIAVREITGLDGDKAHKRHVTFSYRGGEFTWTLSRLRKALRDKPEMFDELRPEEQSPVPSDGTSERAKALSESSTSQPLDSDDAYTEWDRSEGQHDGQHDDSQREYGNVMRKYMEKPPQPQESNGQIDSSLSGSEDDPTIKMMAEAQDRQSDGISQERYNELDRQIREELELSDEKTHNENDLKEVAYNESAASLLKKESDLEVRGKDAITKALQEKGMTRRGQSEAMTIDKEDLKGGEQVSVEEEGIDKSEYEANLHESKAQLDAARMAWLRAKMDLEDKHRGVAAKLGLATSELPENVRDEISDVRARYELAKKAHINNLLDARQARDTDITDRTAAAVARYLSAGEMVRIEAATVNLEAERHPHKTRALNIINKSVDMWRKTQGAIADKALKLSGLEKRGAITRFAVGGSGVVAFGAGMTWATSGAWSVLARTMGAATMYRGTKDWFDRRSQQKEAQSIREHVEGRRALAGAISHDNLRAFIDASIAVSGGEVDMRLRDRVESAVTNRWFGIDAAAGAFFAGQALGSMAEKYFNDAPTDVHGEQMHTDTDAPQFDQVAQMHNWSSGSYDYLVEKDAWSIEHSSLPEELKTKMMDYAGAYGEVVVNALNGERSMDAVQNMYASLGFQGESAFQSFVDKYDPESVLRTVEAAVEDGNESSYAANDRIAPLRQDRFVDHYPKRLAAEREILSRLSELSDSERANLQLPQALAYSDYSGIYAQLDALEESHVGADASNGILDGQRYSAASIADPENMRYDPVPDGAGTVDLDPSADVKVSSHRDRITWSEGGADTLEGVADLVDDGSESGATSESVETREVEETRETKEKITISEGGSMSEAVRQAMEAQSPDREITWDDVLPVINEFAEREYPDEAAKYPNDKKWQVFNLVHPGDAISIVFDADGSVRIENFTGDVTPESYNHTTPTGGVLREVPDMEGTPVSDEIVQPEHENHIAGNSAETSNVKSAQNEGMEITADFNRKFLTMFDQLSNEEKEIWQTKMQQAYLEMQSGPRERSVPLMDIQTAYSNLRAEILTDIVGSRPTYTEDLIAQNKGLIRLMDDAYKVLDEQDLRKIVQHSGNPKEFLRNLSVAAYNADKMMEIFHGRWNSLPKIEINQAA